MKTKFTRGEWTLDFTGRFINTKAKIQGNVICIAPSRELIESNLKWKENAQLISAAPDLFEALINIENDDNKIPATIWEMRNKALNKALGEEIFKTKAE
jgi:hypothetical protein